MVWWCCWILIQTWMLYQANVPASTAFTDAMVSIALLGACCIFIINNMRYYLPKKERYGYVIFMSFALSAVWLFVSKIILKIIFKGDQFYLQVLNLSLVLRYAIAFLIIACNTLASLLWYSQKEQREDSERKADIEKIARDAELNKIRHQLQPHFLFNSLNSISALTGQQPEKARHMIQQLSDFLRGTLKNESQQWINLQNEIEYLELYLDIEKVRFGYRLRTMVNCPAETLEAKLPSMLLQPLVENAIKFGLYDTIGEVEIKISATIQNNMLQVAVHNPFDESTAMPFKGNGFGLSSVRRRLFLLFGRHDLLEIKKEDQQFIVLLNVPMEATPADTAA